MKIFNHLKNLGYSVTLDGENIRLRYLGIGKPPMAAQALVEELRARKPEAVEYLKVTQPKPFFDRDGSVVIPFGSDPRYHYWNGGQSIEKTEREMRQWVH